jgi:hypothetical protein
MIMAQATETHSTRVTKPAGTEPAGGQTKRTQSKQSTVMLKTKEGQPDVTFSKRLTAECNFVSSHTVFAAHFYPAVNVHN